MAAPAGLPTEISAQIHAAMAAEDVAGTLAGLTPVIKLLPPQDKWQAFKELTDVSVDWDLLRFAIQEWDITPRHARTLVHDHDHWVAILALASVEPGMGDEKTMFGVAQSFLRFMASETVFELHRPMQGVPTRKRRLGEAANDKAPKRSKTEET